MKEGKHKKDIIPPLFNRNFLLLIIGQIVSLFANTITRFALPVYLFDKTGSPLLFGLLLSASSVPLIVSYPIGGILAERENRKHIMIVLDIIAGLSILVFIATAGQVNPIMGSAILMAVLSVVQALYKPAVLASIPGIVHPDNQKLANGIVSEINNMASFTGPMMGGILYVLDGISAIVIVASMCFFICGLMELFLKIHFDRSEHPNGIFAAAIASVKSGLRFIINDKPKVLKSALVCAGVSMFLSPVIYIGNPVIIKKALYMTNIHYGITYGLVAAGGFTGGLLAAAFARGTSSTTKEQNLLKVHKHLYVLLLGAAAALIPIGISLMLGWPKLRSYAILTVSAAISTGFIAGFNMLLFGLIKKETPDGLAGGVMAGVIGLSMFAQVLGQCFYGFVFQYVPAYGAIFVSVLITFLLVLWQRAVMGKF